jgi:CHAD domain-containing protein
MALAQSMKDFVNDVKASRRSRHGFVKGNSEIAKNIMADNRRFLQSIRTQNKVNAEQTHAFLKSAKETRMENYKKSQESIKATLTRIHQAKEAITQGAHEMVKEFREDAQMAHKYWASLATDEPIGEPKTATASKGVKKSGTKPEESHKAVSDKL